jgi:arsenate reductase-like glutaredoxin family protein
MGREDVEGMKLSDLKNIVEQTESKTVVIKRKRSDRQLPGMADMQDPTDEIIQAIHGRVRLWLRQGDSRRG